MEFSEFQILDKYKIWKGWSYSKMQPLKGKNVKTYLTHFPIKSYIEADILSKETTWKIMDDIRQAGANGITAEEITKKETFPASVVYATLKELYRLEFIFLYPRGKRIKGDRKRRFVCERGTWGKYVIDREFDAALKVNGLFESITHELKEPIMKVLRETYDQFSAKRELQRFLPTRNTNICPNCQRSHEAMEFFHATILRTVDLMITESDEFKKFLLDKGYAKD